MHIPNEVKEIILKLEQEGFAAYVIGGCVRDLLNKIEPKDWDVVTSATPEEIQKVFPNSFYKNKFLTVTVKTESKQKELKEVEITTYRKETKYTDKRHPDEVRFAKTLEEDLSRRDFTVNAIALKIKDKGYELIDLYKGQVDLKNKTIRAIGKPEERFNEDALRMLRAVRFATTLNFKIEANTFAAIKQNAAWLKVISQERIRDELVKIIKSKNAAAGIELLRMANLLKYIIPELEEGYQVAQNKHHIYDCYEHNLKSLDYAAKKNFSLEVRIAALLHDVAKPRVKAGTGADATFYGHEIVGAKVTKDILNRLRFPKKEIDKIVKLVRYHLFYYNVDEVGEASVRRLVLKVGLENMEELLQLRMADRIGSGVPKAEPYKLRHLKYLIDKVSRQPISVKRLKVDGQRVMELLEIKPGPQVGQVLDILLGYVLEDPKKNTREILEKEVKKLKKLNDQALAKLAQEARAARENIEMKEEAMTKAKYWVT